MLYHCTISYDVNVDRTNKYVVSLYTISYDVNVDRTNKYVVSLYYIL